MFKQNKCPHIDHFFHLCDGRLMAKTHILTLADALKWVQQLPPTCELEGAPKDSSRGRPPDATFRRLSRDLSDLPRGERWLVRPKGSTGGVVMLLSHTAGTSSGSSGQDDPGTAISAEFLPGGSLYDRERSLLVRERQLIAEQHAFLDQRQRWERESAELELIKVRTRSENQRMATEAMDRAEKSQTVIADLQIKLAAALEGKVEANATAEIARQVGYTGNRIVDAVVLWRLKKASDGGLDLPSLLKMLPDEWHEDIKEWMLQLDDMPAPERMLQDFFAWRRHVHAAGDDAPEGDDEEN